MKNGRDLTTLFREGSEHLRLTPTQGAWQRLEERLGPPAGGGIVRVLWAKRLVAAAAAAAVILAIGVYFFGENLHSGNLVLLTGPTPQHLEMLENTGGCEPFCLVLQARKELPPDYAVIRVK